LSSHAQVLRETRHQVSALVAEQDEQLREAQIRWSQIESLHQQIMIGGPDVRALVEEAEAGEASRRRRHSALLDDLEDDAAATARVLADCCAVVGGRGSRGDASRVTAYLAAQLPGWGDLELARQGRILADDFATLLSPAERDERARQALPFAGSPVFARALLAAWGPAGMRETLLIVGDGDYGQASALPRLVALALGAAARTGTASGAVSDVLATEYVPEWDPNTQHDLAVLGMGVVLAASLTLGSRGLDAPTVASWGRQIAARERAMGAGALARVNPASLDEPPVDPIPSVVAILAAGPATAAAAFLTGPSVWDVLLSRQWDDCGTSLQGLVATAGELEGSAGEEVVRGGLKALGAGLEDDGDPDGWTVNRAAAAAVSPALGAALAAHVSVAGDALAAGAEGEGAADTRDLLRGLGYLTIDRNAAAAVEQALEEWVTVHPVGLGSDGALPQFPGVVIPNAYRAVREYGQRLAYALHGYEEQKEAEDRALRWNMTAGLAAQLVRGPLAGAVAGVAEGYAAMGLDYDGTWDNGIDGGLTFEPDAGLASLTSDERRLAAGIAHQAHESFVGTQSVLGRPRPPTSPVSHWWGPLVDAAVPGAEDLIEDAERRRRHGRMRLPR